jgi:hypothetical protein
MVTQNRVNDNDKSHDYKDPLRIKEDLKYTYATDKLSCVMEVVSKWRLSYLQRSKGNPILLHALCEGKAFPIALGWRRK